MQELAGVEQEREPDLIFQDTTRGHVQCAKGVEKILNEGTTFVLQKELKATREFVESGYFGSTLEIREIPESVVVVYEKHRTMFPGNYFATIHFCAANQEDSRYLKLRRKLEEFATPIES